MVQFRAWLAVASLCVSIAEQLDGPSEDCELAQLRPGLIVDESLRPSISEQKHAANASAAPAVFSAAAKSSLLELASKFGNRVNENFYLACLVAFGLLVGCVLCYLSVPDKAAASVHGKAGAVVVQDYFKRLRNLESEPKADVLDAEDASAVAKAQMLGKQRQEQLSPILKGVFEQHKRWRGGLLSDVWLLQDAQNFFRSFVDEYASFVVDSLETAFCRIVQAEKKALGEKAQKVADLRSARAFELGTTQLLEAKPKLYLPMELHGCPVVVQQDYLWTEQGVFKYAQYGLESPPASSNVTDVQKQALKENGFNLEALVMFGDLQGGGFLVDSTKKHAYPGSELGYRKSMDLDDNVQGGVPWGTVLHGVLHDGWLEVEVEAMPLSSKSEQPVCATPYAPLQHSLAQRLRQTQAQLHKNVQAVVSQRLGEYAQSRFVRDSAAFQAMDLDLDGLVQRREFEQALHPGSAANRHLVQALGIVSQEDALKEQAQRLAMAASEFGQLAFLQGSWVYSGGAFTIARGQMTAQDDVLEYREDDISAVLKFDEDACFIGNDNACFSGRLGVDVFSLQYNAECDSVETVFRGDVRNQAFRAAPHEGINL